MIDDGLRDVAYRYVPGSLQIRFGDRTTDPFTMCAVPPNWRQFYATNG